ncbi:hypothetical protein [Neorhizobium alkalisoli]|uniref:Uncharacterized protein n=1 Tax=Neorhizobium alkalisoli TaxID=528178 RepID=A0A561QGK2_9HYPH|nr:hypothetical protein [Neorhizobium alkalisoli]TWF49494.1 hypothetical protein FHW37_108164 [Neorhizobium alkalisoli]
MPSIVHEYKGYRIAIYSPSGHFAVICPPGSNRVIDFKERQPRATVVEGPLVCLERAQALVESLAAETMPARLP